MADYYQKFSVIVECGSPAAALDLLTRIKDIEKEGEEDENFDNPDLHLGIEHAELEGVVPDGTSVWLASSEGPNLDGIAHMLAEWQSANAIDEPIVLEWSNDCSTPRTDAYGGGAFVIWHGCVAGEDTYTVAKRLIQQMKEDHGFEGGD
jgi:hypothetical protein